MVIVSSILEREESHRDVLWNTSGFIYNKFYFHLLRAVIRSLKINIDSEKSFFSCDIKYWKCDRQDKKKSYPQSW